MARAHPLRWRLEDAAIGALWSCSDRLGPERGSAAGARLFGRLGPLLPFHRVARSNLAAAFPQLAGRERAAILAGMWDNLGRIAGEYPHLARLVAGPDLQLSGFEHLGDVLSAGRGAIIAMAHLGNWELGPPLLQRLGQPFRTVYRPPSNPLLAERLSRMRSAVSPGTLIPKSAGAGRQLVAALGRNEIVGILADQRDSGGLSLPFLGRPALTSAAPARLSLAWGAAILPARIERIAGTRFRFEIAPPLTAPADRGPEAQIAGLTLALNRALEAWVRARPDQWLWIHRRWR